MVADATNAQTMPQVLTTAAVEMGITTPATPSAAKFAALAVRSLPFPTTSSVSAVNAGAATASPTPTRKETTRMCHSWTWSRKMGTAKRPIKAPRANAADADNPRRSRVSASTPPGMLKHIIPRPQTPMAAPSQNGESVTVRVSHPCTTQKMNPPKLATAPADQSNLNWRCVRSRSIWHG